MGPLVPSDVDLRDFAFMPVDVHRVLTSETWILGSGDERAAAMTLWMVSWHQVPAGSLPDNDRMLAHLSQARNWSKVRAHALRGWALADDGRFYHPVVAEKVLEAWLEKLAQRLSSGAGNAKRWGAEFDPAPIEEQMRECRGMLSALNPQSRALSKKRTSGMPSASRRDTPGTPVDGKPGVPNGVPNGVPSGSQGTGTGTGNLNNTPPNPPVGGKSAGDRKMTFKTWVESMPPGEDAIPATDPVFAYATKVGIPHDYIALAWIWFERKYLDEKPRVGYISWRQHFRNAVENNWPKLWWVKPDGCGLTTAGEQMRLATAEAA